MRVIAFLVRKEFLQVFRNKGILPILFLMPIVQLLILSYAADFEIRNLKVYWIDQDQSTASHRLRGKLEASRYFILQGTSFNPSSMDEVLERRQADLVFRIPNNFERDLLVDGNGEIQLVVDAVDGTKAGLGMAYANVLVQELAQEIRNEYGNKMPIRPIVFKQIEGVQRFWFNPELDYKTFMVPGILVLLVTMIGVFVSSMNIVREKELGTIEQLNVTPIKKYQFICGKLIPLWIIGLFEFALGLTVAKLVFNIPIVGSIGLLFGFTALYLIMVLGLGMLISTLTETQQQAMFISWFLLVIFILMSGLFTPIENMPPWAQQITVINPIRYFIEVIRMVMLKGATFTNIQWQMSVVAMYAVAINALAIWRYRKTV